MGRGSDSEDIQYDLEWGIRLESSVKSFESDHLFDGNEKFNLKEIGDRQWLVQCPFCKSSFKINVTNDVDSKGRKSINFRKTHFDQHLKSNHGKSLPTLPKDRQHVPVLVDSPQVTKLTKN